MLNMCSGIMDELEEVSAMTGQLTEVKHFAFERKSSIAILAEAMRYQIGGSRALPFWRKPGVLPPNECFRKEELWFSLDIVDWDLSPEMRIAT